MNDQVLLESAGHAKDDDARRYYERFGFIASPSDPTMFALIKDLRRIAGE